MTTTAAAIPAETAIAQHSEYDAALPIDEIQPHPHNIRHNAVADDELVASIAEQGLLQALVVTPAAIVDGVIQGYLLIAGHRRLDGLKRAGFTSASAVIRYDLKDEADQIAAMLVENGRRADLTPIEEAEGFDLLTELGWTVDDIAAASGRSKTTVKERRKLTALKDNTKGAVDAGQVTIDDAIRIAKLPPAEQTHMDKYLGKGDFRLELSRTEERSKARTEMDATAKKLLTAGVPEIQVPKKVTSIWDLTHADHGCVRLATTGKPDASDHDGCLAFIRGGTKQYPQIWQVCTDPGKHDDDLTAEQLERKAAREAAEAERERAAEERAERQRAENTARQLRVDALVAAIKPKAAIDPTLEAILRITLPDSIRNTGLVHWAIFQTAAGVPEDQRWSGGYPPADNDWVNDLGRASTRDLLKALTAHHACAIESRLARQYAPEQEDADRAAAYFATLAAAGHERNSIDQELLDALLKGSAE